MLKSINIAVRFLLELCVLLAVGYWGFTFKSVWPVKIILGLVLPIFIAVLWGRFGAPKSTTQLRGIMLFGLEILVFGSGVAALFATGYDILAWGFAVFVVINKLLLFIWQQ